MSNDNVDKRVVELDFDNKKFEKNARQSMSTLDKLKDSLNFDGISDSVDKASKSINKMEIATITAVANISNRLTNFGINFAKSMSVDNVSAGWTKFGDKTIAVSTLAAQSLKVAGKEIDNLDDKMSAINENLSKLEWFSDETSYSFTDMVNNLGYFTAAGQDLDKSTEAMMGIANWAALSGQNSRAAARAMYQLSQAMSRTINLMDYRSIQTLNMDTSEFRQLVLDTAVSMGELTKESDKFVTKTGKKFDKNGFTQYLSDGWFTGDVLVNTLQKYSAAVDEIYQITQKEGITASEAIEKYGDSLDSFAVKAFKSAQSAKTFNDVINSVKDAVTSQWTKTFEFIFGSYEDAQNLWTDLANELNEVFVTSGYTRNDILKSWRELGGRSDLFARGGDNQGAFWNIYDSMIAIRDLIKSSWDKVFNIAGFDNYDDKVGGLALHLKQVTSNIREFTEQMRVSEDTGGKLRQILTGIFDVLKTGLFTVKAITFAVSPLLELVRDSLSYAFDLLSELSDGESILEHIRGNIERVSISVHDYLESVIEVIDINTIVSSTINFIRSSITMVSKILKKMLPLLQAVLRVIGQIVDFLVEIPKYLNDISIKLTGNGIVENLSIVIDAITFAFNKIADFIAGSNTEEIGKSIEGKVQEVSNNIINPLMSFGQWIYNSFIKLKEFLTKAFNKVREIITSVWEKMQDIYKTISDLFSNKSKSDKKLVQKRNAMMIGPSAVDYDSNTGSSEVDIFSSFSAFAEYLNKQYTDFIKNYGNSISSASSNLEKIAKSFQALISGATALVSSIAYSLGVLFNTVSLFIQKSFTGFKSLAASIKELWETSESFKLVVYIVGILTALTLLISALIRGYYALMVWFKPVALVLDSLSGWLDSLRQDHWAKFVKAIGLMLLEFNVSLALLLKSIPNVEILSALSDSIYRIILTLGIITAAVISLIAVLNFLEKKAELASGAAKGAGNAINNSINIIDFGFLSSKKAIKSATENADKFRNSFDQFGRNLSDGISKGLTGAFGDIANAAKNYATLASVSMLINSIGTTVLKIAISLRLLKDVPLDDVKKASISVSIIMGTIAALVASILIYNKLNKQKDNQKEINSISKEILKLSTAVSIFGVVLFIFTKSLALISSSDIPVSKLWNSVGLISVLMAVYFGLTSLLSKDISITGKNKSKNFGVSFKQNADSINDTSKGITKFAGSIALLAGSLLLFSHINVKAAWSAVPIIGSCLLLYSTAMAIASIDITNTREGSITAGKLSGGKSSLPASYLDNLKGSISKKAKGSTGIKTNSDSLKEASKGITRFAAAFSIFSASLLIFNKINISKAWVGIGMVSVLMAMYTVSMSMLSVDMSVGNQITSKNYDSVKQAFVGTDAAKSNVSAAFNKKSQNSASGPKVAMKNNADALKEASKGIARFAAAMLGFSLSLAVLSFIDWGDIGKGVAVIASFSVIYALVISVTSAFSVLLSKKKSINLDAYANTIKESASGMVKFSAAILSFSLAFLLLSKIVSKMSWTTIGQTSTVLLVLSAGIALIVYATSQLAKAGGKDEQSTSKKVTAILGQVSTLVMSLGVSLLAIAGAAKIMESVNIGSMLITMGTLAIVLGGLSLLLLSLSKLSKTLKNTKSDESGEKNMMKVLIGISVVMLSIGAFMLMFAGAVKMMSDVSGDVINKAMITIGIIFGSLLALVITIGAMSSKLTKYTSKNKSLLNLAAVIGAFTASIVVIAASMLMIKDIDWKTMLAFMAPMGLFFGSFIAVMKTLSKEFAKLKDWSSVGRIATLIGAFASSVVIIAAALKIVENVDWKTMLAFMAPMGLFFGSFIAVMKTIGKMSLDWNKTSQIIALVMSFALSMVPLAYSMTLLASMSWDKMLIAALSLSTLLIAIAGAMAILSKISTDPIKTLTIASTFVVLSTSCLLLSTSLKMLASVPIKTIGIALLGFILTLSAIAIVAAVIKRVGISNILISIGVAILSIGVACLLMVAAFQLFMLTMQNSAAFIVENGPLITEAIITLANSITEAAPAIGEAVSAVLTEIFNAIRTSLPSLFSLIKAFILQLNKLLLEVGPDIIETVFKLLETLLIKLNEHLPNIINELINILLSLIKGISDRIGEIVTAITDLAINLFDTLTNNTGRLMLAIVADTVKLVNYIIKSINAAFIGSIEVIIQNTIDLFKQVIEKVIPKLRQLADVTKELILAFADVITYAIVTIGPAIRVSIRAIISNLADQITMALWDILVLKDAFVERLANIIDALWKKLVARLQRIGSTIFDAIGFHDLAKKLEKEADDTVKNLEERLKHDSLAELAKSSADEVTNAFHNAKEGVTTSIKGIADSAHSVKSILADKFTAASDGVISVEYSVDSTQLDETYNRLQELTDNEQVIDVRLNVDSSALDSAISKLNSSVGSFVSDKVESIESARERRMETYDRTTGNQNIDNSNNTFNVNIEYTSTGDVDYDAETLADRFDKELARRAMTRRLAKGTAK